MTINLTFWLILALSASVIVNFITFYYIRVVLGRLMYLGDNLADLTDMVTSYRNHLKSVYEMEMFYGDETLGFLVEHTKSLYDILEDYEDAYMIAMPPENTEEQINNKEEENNNAEKKIPQQDVFYAGTRTSDN
jgi:hypothetical protein